MPPPLPSDEPTATPQRRGPGRPRKNLVQPQRDRSPQSVRRGSVTVVPHPNDQPEAEMQSLRDEIKQLKEKLDRVISTAGRRPGNQPETILPLPANDVRHELMRRQYDDQGNFRDEIQGASAISRLGYKAPVYPDYPVPEYHSVLLPAIMSDRVRAALADPKQYVDYNKLLPANRIPVKASRRVNRSQWGHPRSPWRKVAVTVPA